MLDRGNISIDVRVFMIYKWVIWMNLTFAFAVFAQEVQREGDRLNQLRQTLRRLNRGRSKSDSALQRVEAEYQRLLCQLNTTPNGSRVGFCAL